MYEEVIKLQPQWWGTVKEAPKDWNEYVRKNWSWVVNSWGWWVIWNIDWWDSESIYIFNQILDWWDSY